MTVHNLEAFAKAERLTVPAQTKLTRSSTTSLFRSARTCVGGVSTSPSRHSSGRLFSREFERST